MRRTLLALVGAFLVLSVLPSVAAAAPEPLVSGKPPRGAGIGTVFVSRETTPDQAVAAIALLGCEATTLATTEAGDWRLYVPGAPAFVNASFPALGTGDPLVVRCGEPRLYQAKVYEYACAAGRSFTAHVEQVPGNRVILELDGSVFSLTQRMSGSGIRYATVDDAVWYLAKGDDATIEEDGVATYVDCVGALAVSPAAEALGANVWTWLGTTQGASSVTPNTAGDTRLTFGLDGSLGVGTDCNAYFGVYTAGDASMWLDVQGGTLMFCPDETTTETEVIQALAQVIAYTLDGTDLTLYLPDGQMNFTAAEE
jgi:heat shock protein HslJ